MLLTDDQLKLILSRRNIVPEDKLESAYQYAKESDIPFQDVLVQRELITDENLGLIIADYLGFPFTVLSKLTIPDRVFRLIPERIARIYKIVPFARDANGIKLAMLDPRNTDIPVMLAKKTGEKITVYMATEQDLMNILYIYRKELQKTFDELLKESVRQKEASKVDALSTSKIIDLLIRYGFEDNASDIHIEPQEKTSLIRFRVDGILHDVLVVPKYLHDQLITVIKVLSRLRTDEHLSPQDGKMRMKIEKEEVDIRVSIVPVVEGEKAVLRLLSTHFQHFSLADLGMREKDLQKVTKALHKSYGMILSTGPTGSGKTTSIYSIVKILNIRERNITTIEDPVEYRILGINQIQVNAKTNLTFASGLRSLLRQDPNVLFVGEIRDKETASIAVNAALTGHLVLSTLHTNDAATALPRLIDMEVEPFLVASTVNIIIAQRLVRKICEMCKQSVIVSREEMIKSIPEDLIARYFADKQQITLFIGAGCKVCHGTGYMGRIGIFEVLELNKRIRALIANKSDSDVINKAAREDGMTSMLEDGLIKISQGNTSLEEVIRVTKINQ